MNTVTPDHPLIPLTFWGLGNSARTISKSWFVYSGASSLVDQAYCDLSLRRCIAGLCGPGPTMGQTFASAST